MHASSDVFELASRIAQVKAVGATLEDLRLQLTQVRRQGGDIARDTRWRSNAMAAYERGVGDWQGALADLCAELTAAAEAVGRIADEMVATELLRSAAPGRSVAR